ncbi:2-C-methyl-D-erythritol 4-phosphate cytidylyltransferase [Saccharomonospora sp. CUA-673]|uniref:IspD/TarI family cytidylyltransferase n=1 Tax=Saccharomonospora sp. CUA-673 TaxID=1904969 RepID=UPI000969D27C|nr:IspD/TarI family cytidylyltransferase [Saccharomonospora sp. CUA-673]OLT47093.1 2-C-methyl-D-erythritol 4-phosphate cytidylyltransferase [Saccharomonospora sp. CUA-673]
MAERKSRRPRAGRVPPAAGVVLASGAGTRVGAEMNKVYLPLAGRRLVSWSLGAFARVPEIGVLVLVARPQDADLVEWVLEREVDAPVEVVYGGQSRQESELRALRSLSSRIEDGGIDTVLIHDAARPLVSPSLIAGVLHEAREHGGAIPALPSDDLVTVTSDGTGFAEHERSPSSIVRAQTPQGFRAAPLLEVYERAARHDFVGTDTASFMECFSELPVRWVRGDQQNFKITYPHDLVVAEHVLAADGQI